MKQYRIAGVQVGLLLFVLSANAAVRNSMIRVTILDSETHTVILDDSGVPKNCDGVNFDAYCHNSKTSQVTNTLLVQEGNHPPFRVACSVDTKWSRCAPLPKGSSFDAKREKRGLLVYYVDDNGKVRKQLYTLVASEQGGAEGTVASRSELSAAAQNSGPVENKAQASAANGVPSDVVKCSFSSTPAGAEVTVDGRFIGSTPSVLNLGVGNHSVEVAMPGFAHWKRDLTVSAGSELTVNAVLQKVQ